MPTNQIRLDNWQLQFANTDGVLALDVSVPGLQVQFDYALDCTSASITLSNVKLLNASGLKFAQGAVQQTYPLQPQAPLQPGNSYLTNAVIVLSSFSTSVELQTSIYWAECNPPQDQHGVPRFMFQAQAVVQFFSQTSYYAQKWTGTGWDPTQTKVSSSAQLPIALRSPLSDQSQKGAHVDCQNCLAIPTGAPLQTWQDFDSQTFSIYTAPPVPVVPQQPSSAGPVAPPAAVPPPAAAPPHKQGKG